MRNFPCDLVRSRLVKNRSSATAFTVPRSPKPTRFVGYLREVRGFLFLLSHNSSAAGNPPITCVLFLSIGGATQTGGVFPDTYFFTFFFFYKFLCTIDTITINTTDRPPLDPAGSSNRPTARRGNNVDNNVTQIIRIRVKYTSGRCLIAGIRVLNI